MWAAENIFVRVLAGFFYKHKKGWKECNFFQNFIFHHFFLSNDRIANKILIIIFTCTEIFFSYNQMPSWSLKYAEFWRRTGRKAESWQHSLCGSLLFILEQKNEDGKQIFATCFCSRRRPSLTSGSASPYRNSPGWRLTLIRYNLSLFSQLHSTTNGKYAGLSLPISPDRWARLSTPRLPTIGLELNLFSARPALGQQFPPGLPAPCHRQPRTTAWPLFLPWVIYTAWHQGKTAWLPSPSCRHWGAPAPALLPCTM